MGYYSAKFLVEEGATCLGICEYNSNIYDPNGIDLEKASYYWFNNNTFKGYTGA